MFDTTELSLGALMLTLFVMDNCWRAKITSGGVKFNVATLNCMIELGKLLVAATFVYFEKR